MPNEQQSQVAEDLTVAVASSADILAAREKARETAAQVGFSSTDLTFIATATSALARNIIRFAKRGQITIDAVRGGSRRGIVIVASDQGPGLPAHVLSGNDSSDHVGLRGVRCFMDEVVIDSAPGKGTTITARKWLA